MVRRPLGSVARSSARSSHGAPATTSAVTIDSAPIWKSSAPFTTCRLVTIKPCAPSHTQPVPLPARSPSRLPTTTTVEGSASAAMSAACGACVGPGGRVGAGGCRTPLATTTTRMTDATTAPAASRLARRTERWSVTRWMTDGLWGRAAPYGVPGAGGGWYGVPGGGAWYGVPGGGAWYGAPGGGGEYGCPAAGVAGGAHGDTGGAAAAGPVVGPVAIGAAVAAAAAALASAVRV